MSRMCRTTHWRCYGPVTRGHRRSATISPAARHLRAADWLRLAPPDRAAHPTRPPSGGARPAWSPPLGCALRSARSAGSAVPRASCPSLKWHRERGQAPRPSAPGVAPAVRLRRVLSRPPSTLSLAATLPLQGRCASLRDYTLDRAGPRPPCARQRATRRWLRTVGRAAGRLGRPRAGRRCGSRAAMVRGRAWVHHR